MSDNYREIHTSLNLYWSTPWLISKMLYLASKFQLEWKSACLGAPNVWCLYRLSTRTDQRAAYYFSRNTVNRDFSQKHYSPRKRRNSIIHDLQLFCFTNVQKYRNFRKNTIHWSREFWNNRIPRERK
jgi:hypothetical protein